MKHAISSSLRFEGYLLDLERLQLLHDGAELHLSPKAFQLLRMLVENAPRVLSKKQLYDAIWPDTFVDGSNLAGLIAELRNALNDRQRPKKLIRTVHRIGYSFTGQVQRDEDHTLEPSLRSFRLLWGGREVALHNGETLLGRDPDATVRIDDATVSRYHARIRIDNAAATIEDLGSKNGTKVSGQRVDRRFGLSDGDCIDLGSVRMTFRSVAQAPSTVSIVAPAPR